MPNDTRGWIEALDLAPHPEGGYYRETYRSAEAIARDGLPDRYGGPRSCSTAIYYLLDGPDISRFHRLASDEIWHWYHGSPIALNLLHPNGRLEEHRLGPDPSQNQRFQGFIPRGSWFGGRVLEPAGYTLLGCTVAPGFAFEDFEIADRQALLEQYPQHRAIIETLTPGP